jgi:O-antigen/teichoic acid export membrane protein
MVVAVLNYAFHPILGRLLSPEEFGDIQALISLLAQSAILFGAFSVVAINITANIENENERNAIISELQKIALVIVGISLLALLLCLGELRTFFNFTSIYPLIGLMIILPLSTLITFRNAFLQGKGRFLELSLSGIISSAGRLVFAVLFIFLSLGILGATAGLVLSNVLLLGYLLYRTNTSLHLGKSTDVHILEKGSIKREILYGLLVLAATSIITLFYTVDVLIVKHYFSSEEAGLYSGISAIAKILFFVIGPTATVLLSSVKIKNSFLENSKLLWKSLGISLVVGMAGLFTFYFFYDIVISLMIGDKYGPFAYLLPKVGLVMLLTGIANVFVNYFLALRRFFIIGLAAIGIVCIGGIFLAGHASVDTVITYLTWGLAGTIIFLISVYAKDFINHHTGL